MNFEDTVLFVLIALMIGICAVILGGVITEHRSRKKAAKDFLDRENAMRRKAESVPKKYRDAVGHSGASSRSVSRRASNSTRQGDSYTSNSNMTAQSSFDGGSSFSSGCSGSSSGSSSFSSGSSCSGGDF